MVFLAAWTLGGTGAGAAGLSEGIEDVPKDPRMADLVTVIYGMNVAAQCGLVDRLVFDGYRHRVQAQILRHGLTQIDIRRAWIAADIAFELEYGNRGLGGQRNWCRTEGIDAARDFAAYRTSTMGRDIRPSGSR